MQKYLVALAIAVATVFLAGCKGDLTPEQQASRDASNARAACVTFIRPQLNNPSSVEWVDRGRWPVRVDERGHFHVTVTFRAANAFGGMVTERYTCIARPTDNRPIAYMLVN